MSYPGRAWMQITLWRSFPLPLAGGLSADQPGILDREQIFAWPIWSDPWADVEDDALRITLEDEFAATFSASAPEKERGLAAFSLFIERLQPIADRMSNDVGERGVEHVENDFIHFFSQLASMRDTFRIVEGLFVQVS